MASVRDRSARARKFRSEMKSQWEPVNEACIFCGQADIDWHGPANAPQSFEIHHVKDPENFPHLEFDPSNVRASHSRCNRAAGRGSEEQGIGETSEAW